MHKQKALPGLAMLAVGSLLGLLAANAEFPPPLQAAASQGITAAEQVDPAGPPATAPAVAQAVSTRTAGLSRADQVALVNHNLMVAAALSQAEKNGAAKKPNILVIFGDDVGQSNISAYTHGLVGYHTPNIDRIAKEGLLFTDVGSPGTELEFAL